MMEGMLSPITGPRCTGCRVRRAHCSRTEPRAEGCSLCQHHGNICDWNGQMGPHVFSMFDESLNLNGLMYFSRTDHYINNGSFGDVYRSRLTSGPLVAVKVPRCSLTGRSRTLYRSIREALTWAMLDHPNILKLRGITTDPASDRISLVSDWMENGHVVQYLECNPETNRLTMALGIVKGVRYLHGLTPPVVHGDLKGNNVLVSRDGTPLLTDFGLSYVADDPESTAFTGGSTATAINARWCAPERMNEEHDGAKMGLDTRTREADVFSMSRTLLEIFTGAKPYAEISRDFTVIVKAMNGEQPARPEVTSAWQGVQNTLWQIMTACWNLDPQQRPNVSQIHDRLELLNMAVRRRDGRALRSRRLDPRDSVVSANARTQIPAHRTDRDIDSAPEEAQASTSNAEAVDLRDGLEQWFLVQPDEQITGSVREPESRPNDELPEAYVLLTPYILPGGPPPPETLTLIAHGTHSRLYGASPTSPTFLQTRHMAYKHVPRPTLASFREILIQLSLHHGHLLGAEGAWLQLQPQIDMNTAAPSELASSGQEPSMRGWEIWVRMERMEWSLADISELVGDELDLGGERVIARLMADALEGLRYLHTNGFAPVVHRNVRSDNLLLAGDGRLLIADFFLAIQLPEERPTRDDVVGTWYWLAPELRAGVPYTTAVDIYALGATLWELIEGVPPHSNVRSVELLRTIRQLPPLSTPLRWSVELRAFLAMCNADSRERPTASDLLESPFIQSAGPRSEVVALLKRAQRLEDTILSRGRTLT